MGALIVGSPCPHSTTIIGDFAVIPIGRIV